MKLCISLRPFSSKSWDGMKLPFVDAAARLLSALNKKVSSRRDRRFLREVMICDGVARDMDTVCIISVSLGFVQGEN